MKTNKNNLRRLAALMALMIITISCNKDKNVYVDDFAVTIDENPVAGYELGTINATTEKSFITYTLISESVEGALEVDASSGVLTVKDPLLFNYEYNTTITAQVEASNGKNDEICNVTITLNDVYEVPANIGDFRDGGVVFWVDPQDPGKGLVCAVSDQGSSSNDWGCYSITDPTEIDGADGTAVGTGAQNTSDIIAGCSSSSSAAYLCENLALNGYSDWFLPSKDEAYEMYLNMAAINATATANGGTNIDTGVYYWTSSEYSGDKAYDIYFATGTSEASLKLNYFSVRAVRAF